MATTLAILLLGLAVVIQASLSALFLPVDGGPNLVFLMVLAWSLNTNLRSGIIWALAGGLLLDLLSLLPVGTSALGLLVLVFVVSGLGTQLYRVGALWLIGLTATGTIFQEMLVLILLDFYVLGGLLPSDNGFDPTWGRDFGTVVLPTLVYNLLLIAPVYGLLRRVQRRFGLIE